MTTDKRYRTQLWRRVRLIALSRDGYRCRIVESCQRRATVADHIAPVYDGMPDHEFYALSNLRAACAHHNLRRGHVLRFEREVNGEADAAGHARPTVSLFGSGQMTAHSRNLSPIVAGATIFGGNRGNRGG